MRRRRAAELGDRPRRSIASIAAFRQCSRCASRHARSPCTPEGTTDTVVWNPGRAKRGAGAGTICAADALRCRCCASRPPSRATRTLRACAAARPGTAHADPDRALTATPRTSDPVTAEEERLQPRARQGAMAPVGPVPVRAAMGHGARGLQLRTAPRGNTCRTITRARAPTVGARTASPASATTSSSCASRSRCGTAPIRSSRSACSA